MAYSESPCASNGWKSLFGQVHRSLTWLILAAGLLLLPEARAERYLTVEEARKLCFPTADTFQAQTVRFTPAQKKAIEKQTQGKVLNLGNRFYIARRGTNVLGVMVLDHVLGKHEIIDYAVAITPAGAVAQVEILEFRESHGYEIRSAPWRAQFKGKTAAAPLRLHGDIYNLSGATISCRQITEGVKRVLATYDLVLRHHAGLARGLPDSPARPPS